MKRFKITIVLLAFIVLLMGCAETKAIVQGQQYEPIVSEEVTLTIGDIEARDQLFIYDNDEMMSLISDEGVVLLLDMAMERGDAALSYDNLTLENIDGETIAALDQSMYSFYEGHQLVDYDSESLNGRVPFFVPKSWLDQALVFNYEGAEHYKITVNSPKEVLSTYEMGDNINMEDLFSLKVLDAEIVLAGEAYKGESLDLMENIAIIQIQVEPSATYPLDLSEYYLLIKDSNENYYGHSDLGIKEIVPIETLATSEQAIGQFVLVLPDEKNSLEGLVFEIYNEHVNKAVKLFK